MEQEVIGDGAARLLRPHRPRLVRFVLMLSHMSYLALFALHSGAAQEDAAPEAAQARQTRLHDTVSWSLSHVPAGNPFDVRAVATFTHDASGEVESTDLFWTGEGTYALRFTPTRAGRWTWATQSDVSALDGATGVVVVAPGELPGALTGIGTRFAQTDGAGFRGALHHPYHLYDGSELSEYPADLEGALVRVDEVLDTVEAQGFRSLFLSLKHALLAYGASSYDDHDSVNPDLTTFAVLDALLDRAHARGMTVHFWLWGDEQRRQTPVGLPGGVNGHVDRRLQRYVAARLGPLPGWSMAYGFDLEEWAGPETVRDWADFLQEHMQLAHLLTAREKNPRGGFDLGAHKLSLFSVDDRPGEGPSACYEAAVRRLKEQDGQEPPVPVLFERRFVYQRDDVWSEDRTRRCLWQLTMAGGAGAVWGEPFDRAAPYPTPVFYRTFFEFWEGRFGLDLERVAREGRSWALAAPDRQRSVTYAEEASRVVLDLSGGDASTPVVAVDTLTGATFDLGRLAPRTYAWTAPYRSDWAIAAGSFPP